MVAGRMAERAIMHLALWALVFCSTIQQVESRRAHNDKFARDNDGRATVPIAVKDLPGRPLLVHNPLTALHHHSQPRSQTKLRTTYQGTPTDLEQNIEASGKSHYLVRVSHPAPEDMMQSLRAASGDKDLQYIPHDTYILAMELHIKSRVEALQGVEALFHLPSGMKVSPTLNQLLASTKQMVPSNANDVHINADPVHPEKRGNTHFRDREAAESPRNRFHGAMQDKKFNKQMRMERLSVSGASALNQEGAMHTDESKDQIELDAPAFLEVTVSLQQDKSSTLELLKAWESFFNPKTGKIAQVWAKTDSKFSIETNHQHLDLIVSYLANQAAVKYIEKRIQFQTMNMYASLVVKGVYQGGSVSDGLQRKGLNGTGQIVGISDTGIDFDSCFFDDPKQLVYVCNNCYMYNYAGCSLQCPSQSSHRKIVSYNSFTPPPPPMLSYDGLHGHGTHVSGTVAGAASSDRSLATLYNGTASGAKIVFDDISNTEYYLNYLPWDLYHNLYPHAYDNGARVHSNSWGSYGGYYDFTSHETDSYMYDHDDFLIVFAAGNNGPYHFSVGSPSSAKNVLSVGSSLNARESYIAHGYGDYYNLSMTVSDGMRSTTFDILPATFGLILNDSIAAFSAPVVSQDFNSWCYSNSYYLWGSRCRDLSGLLCLPVQEQANSCSEETTNAVISGRWQGGSQIVGYDFFSGHVSTIQVSGCSAYGWPVPSPCQLRLDVPDYDASSTTMELIIEIAFIWYSGEGYVSRVEGIRVNDEFVPFDTSRTMPTCPMTMSYVYKVPQGVQTLRLEIVYDQRIDPYLGACIGENSGVIAYLLSSDRPSWEILYDSNSQTNNNYYYNYPGEYHLTQISTGMDLCVLGHNSSDQLVVSRSGTIFFGPSSQDQLSDLPVLRVDEETEFRPALVAGKKFDDQGVQGYSLFVRAYNSEHSMFNEFQINLFSNNSISIAFGPYGDTGDYVQLMIKSFAVYSFLPVQYNTYLLSGFERPARSYFSQDFSGKIIMAPYISYYSGSCDEAVMASNAEYFGANGLILYEPFRQSPPLHLTGSSRPSVAASVNIPVAGVAGLDVEKLQMMSRSSFCVGGSSSVCYNQISSGQFPVVSSQRTAQSFKHTDLSYFSSRGPTFDLRNKPDIVAPGQNIFSASSDGLAQSYQCASTVGQVDSCVVEMSGTSMATPAAAGAAAIVRQYFSEGYHDRGNYNKSSGINPSAALVKAMIVHSGRQIRNLVIAGSRLVRDATWGYLGMSEGSTWQWQESEASPSVEQGYGLMNLSAVLWFGNESDFKLKVLDRQAMRQGSSLALCFNVLASSSFRATLVWTDPPASMYASTLLVNNLDLLVVSESGQFWYGNNRTAGNADSVNNVEQVTVSAAAAGVYRVIVVGSDVPQGPQNFSLVVTGQFGQSAPCSDAVACPAGCSGHGTCTNGLCSCNAGYVGFGCESVLACGDGVVEDGEECDDGNGMSGDGCSSTCTIENFFRCEQELWPGRISRCTRCSCGCMRFTDSLGTVDSSLNPYPGSSSSSCTWDIEPTSLTNLQITFPQSAENSNLNVQIYMCSDAACSSWNYVGWMTSTSSNLWMPGAELFRRAIRSDQPKLRIVSYSPFLLHYGPITYNVCGDGIQEGLESCDDGNTVSGDGCSSSCKRECLITSCCHFDLSPNDLFARKFEDEVAPGATCATFTIKNPVSQGFLENELAITPNGMQSDTCPFSPTMFEPSSFKLYGSASQSESRNASSSFWTRLFPSSAGSSQSTDDGYWLLPDFGFDFCFQGSNVRYRTYLSSNSYISFFQGYPYYSGLTPSWPPSPTLFIGGADNSVQLILTKRVTEGGRMGLVVRFEGTASTWGTMGDPNIIWEATFFDDNSIRVSVGRMTNSAGLSILSDGKGGTMLSLPFREKSALKVTITDLCHVALSAACDLLAVTSPDGSSIVANNRFQVFRGKSLSLSYISNARNRSSVFPFDLSWGFKSKPLCGNGLRDWTFVMEDKAECNADPELIYNGMYYGYYVSPVASCNTPLRLLRPTKKQLYLIVEMDAVTFYYSSWILNVTLNGISIPFTSPAVSSYGVCGSYEPVVRYKIPSSTSGPVYNLSISTMYSSCWYCSQTYSPNCKVFFARAYLATVEDLEECDDGNQINRDGCSNTCHIETNANCSSLVQEDASFQQGPDLCQGDLSYLGSRLSVCSTWMSINSSSSFPWLWGDTVPVAYKSCKLPYSWDEVLVPLVRNCSLSYKTGGLGHLLTPQFQSWICVKHHPCAWDERNPYFCFVYDEDNAKFVPWGRNSDLQLVPLE